MSMVLRVLAAAALVVLFVSTSSASFTTEVLFSGEGWYLNDGGGNHSQGYGLFSEVAFSYSVASDMPEGTHCLYFMPDYTLVLRPENPGGADVHRIAMNAAGLSFDGQDVAWSEFGLVWAPGYGIEIGEQFVSALDPDAVVGNHQWDLDGGKPDFSASVWAMKGPGGKVGPSNYRADFSMHRSLTWLSGQSVGTWLGGGLAPLLGGLPLDGLDDALNSMAPSLASWDRAYYAVNYEGSLTLTGCATPVPEPSTILLLSGGLAALVTVGRKRMR